ncbi:putative transcription factor C2H2 family [Helianthus anomalus]
MNLSACLVKSQTLNNRSLNMKKKMHVLSKIQNQQLKKTHILSHSICLLPFIYIHAQKDNAIRSITQDCARKLMAEMQITSIDQKLTMAQQELKINDDQCNDSGPILFDCVVCLCEVAPEDSRSNRLTNCEHGVQFHDECIESWLKDHPTCPLCRSHVSWPVCLRLKAYLFKVRDDMVSYCNNALDNVASSINDCDDS